MIYATLLPTGILKIGRATRLSRATFARQYFVEPIRVLAVWETGGDAAAERKALKACAPYHVRGELHSGDAATMVGLITLELGEPRATDLQHFKRGRPRKGEVRQVSYTEEEKASQRAAGVRHHIRKTLGPVCDLI